MAKHKYENPVEDNPFSTVGGVALAVMVAVGLYAKFALLVPSVAAAVLGGTLAKFLQPPRKSFVAAVAIPFGHGVWMLVGMLGLGEVLPLLLLEALVLLLVPALFLFVPPLIPAIPLALLHILGAVVNVLAFATTEFDTPVHRALLVHIVFRIGALVGIGYGLLAWYRPSAGEPGREYRWNSDKSTVEPVEKKEDPRPPARWKAEEDGSRGWQPPAGGTRPPRWQPPADGARHPRRPYREDEE